MRDGTARILSALPNYSFVVSHGGTFCVGIFGTSAEAGLARYDFAGGGPAARIASHGSFVTSVALDPSDTLIASGSDDGTVRIGPVSGSEPHLLLGHRSVVAFLAFSPDGHWLASGGQDRTIRLWRVPDVTRTPLHKRPYAELLAVLRSHTNLRAVPDSKQETGWGIETGPFPGWAKLPEW